MIESTTIHTTDDHCEDIVVYYRYHYAEYPGDDWTPMTRDFDVYLIEATYTDGSVVPPENLTTKDLENLLFEKLI